MIELSQKNSAEEIKILNERLSRLAQEKSFLQLTINLIKKITSVSGLDKTADHILQGVLNVIGGTNLVLYYRIDEEIHYADIAGEHKVLDRFDDDRVLTVFTTGTPLEEELDFSNTRMMTAEFTKALTWVYPLKIATEVIGVLKIEHLHIRQQGISSHIETLFNYIAMALNNEILGHTRLKKANDELRQTRATLQAAMDQSPAGIVIADTLDAKFRYVNDAGRLILGADLESVAKGGMIDNYAVSFRLLDLDGRALENEEAPLVRAIRLGETNSRELIIRRKKGDDRVVFSNAAPIFDESGKVSSGIVVFTDITDLKNAEKEKFELEKQLQYAQKMESLGVLSGGIAHDFNNILAIITGYCGMAKMAPGNVERYIPEIEKASERAAELCRQMLAYAGKNQFVQANVNFGALVGDMASLLTKTLPKNTEIKFAPPTEIPCIRGDASQLGQIVMNLIINASEAIGNEQGEIHVSLKETVMYAGESDRDHNGTAISPGRYLCLEVSDNGCGMNEQTKLRIFEPFYTTKFTGRGLGMSAVHGIINSHHGALQLFTQPGKGTTFKVYLPVQKSDSSGEEEHGQIAPSESWKGSGTILLVEDEGTIRDIAKTFLEMFGFTVLEAVNGKEALEVYRKNAADIKLVLTDVGMPVMDGYQLFHELKNLTPELPIIVSSGYGDAEVSSRIGIDNIAGLISKPYSYNQLREVLKGTLEEAMPAHA